MISRFLNLPELLDKSRSAFLFGPRGVGKTVLSKEFIKDVPFSFEIDLLNNDLYTRYLTRPGSFRDDIEYRIRAEDVLTVFVDEVQKLPVLLDEVHLLIERHKERVRFLLTGSSARKLKRGGANLLAGRAWTLKLHPLTHLECDIDLNRALAYGTLPAIYLDDKEPARTLKAYVETYLKEEILQEALVRKVEGFVRFLDVAGQMNSEPVNFTKVARDCGVSPKTAQDFFSILVDTLVAFRIDAWAHSARKQLRLSPKFYFFDCGVLNAIRGELRTELKERSYRFGKLFESYIIQEIIRLNDYLEADYNFYYWRTNTGMEVDIILSRSPTEAPVAIEIKSQPAPDLEDCRGLLSFRSENPSSRLLCICAVPNSYKLGDIEFLPWREAMGVLFK